MTVRIIFHVIPLLAYSAGLLAAGILIGYSAGHCRCRDCGLFFWCLVASAFLVVAIPILSLWMGGR